MNDTTELRRAYSELRARRAAASASSPVPLEEILALAEQPPTDAAGLAALDAVLAHPASRDEYIMLRSIARANANRARMPRWYAAAAVALLALGVPLLWPRDGSSPVTRGGEEGFAVVSPATDDVALRAGQTVVWRSVARAAYRVELLDSNALTAWSLNTADTLLVVPAVSLQPGAAYTLRVTATTPEGADVSTPARRIIWSR